MKIALNVLQRFNLCNLIRQQPCDNYDRLSTLGDILDKINFEKEIADGLVKDLGDGRAIVHQDNLSRLMRESAGETEFELEKAEARTLKNLIEPSLKFQPTVLDRVWLTPLRKQLYENN